MLQGVQTDLVRAYFEDRFDKLPPWNRLSWQDAPQNKISALLRDERNRLVLGQQRSSFNIREIMDHSKVFIARLPKGRLQDAAFLIGALLLKMFHLKTYVCFSTGDGRCYIERSSRIDGTSEL